jgi:hypothetical protein
MSITRLLHMLKYNSTIARNKSVNKSQMDQHLHSIKHFHYISVSAGTNHTQCQHLKMMEQESTTRLLKPFNVDHIQNVNAGDI